MKRAGTVNERTEGEMNMESCSVRWPGGRFFAAVLIALFVLWILPVSAPAITVSGFSGEIHDAEGGPQTQAGSHPDAASTTFTVAGFPKPDESVRDVSVSLPAGFIGNPRALPTCSEEQIGVSEAADCPVAASVGIAEVRFGAPFGASRWFSSVYNMPAPVGAPAMFGFNVAGVIVHAVPRLRSQSDNGIDLDVRDTSQALAITSTKLTLWGVPADTTHSGFRGICLSPAGESAGSCPAGITVRPFLTLPSDCAAGPLPTSVRANSWQNPQSYGEASFDHDPEGNPLLVDGCEKLSFKPKMEVTASSGAASSPAGLRVQMSFPQTETPNGLGTPPLRDARVLLPEGFGLNPATADGQGACTDAQLALRTTDPLACPEASKIGTVEAVTPLLADPVNGSVYLRTQNSSDPQGGEMYRLAIAFEDEERGISIRLPGQVKVNPSTGQVEALFKDNPQLPVETLSVDLKSGPRAPLSTPSVCGTYPVKAFLTPWSSADATQVTSSVSVSSNCSAKDQFTPGFSAGTTNPVGGSYSPFTLRVTRPDGQQNVSTIAATLPQGVLAKLAGVPLCPEGSAGSGDCPASSQIGSATVGAGAGSNPLYVPQPGKPATAVYLAGPYKGAPYSLVAKVPAQAGPFDLGTVTVRNAILIDPTTAQVSVKSDPLPQIIQGIPIAYRDIRVDVDKDQFTLNPTSCDPMEVKGTIGSAQGTEAKVADRFQVANCERLAFKPKLALRLSGAPTRRGGYPKLTATLTMPKEGANIEKAVVTLPKTEYLANAHIRTICTRVQYAAGGGGGAGCPAASVYGYAKAFSPLLDQPLQGPVYLRSSSNKLPDLVASLDGQIHVDLVGRIDSVNARIRNTFATVPDAPVSKFVLTMQGGRKGLLVNNTNLCKAKPRASTRFDGQNGKISDSNPLVKVGGCGKKAKRQK
jgi:hypothetical protein